MAFWRKPAIPAPSPPTPSVHPVSPPRSAADPPEVPPEVEDLLRALWADDPVGVEIAAQGVAGRGLEASITAQVATLGLLSARLAREAGIAPDEASLAPEVLARLQARGHELVQQAGPLLRRFAPQADEELVGFCVQFASGAVSTDEDFDRLETADPVLMMRIGAVLLVQAHRPAPPEDLLTELRALFSG